MKDKWLQRVRDKKSSDETHRKNPNPIMEKIGIKALNVKFDNQGHHKRHKE